MKNEKLKFLTMEEPYHLNNLTKVLDRIQNGAIDLPYPTPIKIGGYFFAIPLSVMGNWIWERLGTKGVQYLPGYSWSPLKHTYESIGGLAAWSVNVGIS